MNISRRWFLKSAVMAAVATQLPRIAEDGHRVLFIDGAPYFVQDYAEKDGVIRAKVVNGLWDMVLDTKKKSMECWSNPGYGYDVDQTVECKNRSSYKKLMEIRVSKDIGEVTDDLKPYTIMVPKFEDRLVQKTETIKGEYSYLDYELPVKDENGKPMMEMQPVPVMKKVTQTWDRSKEKHWVEESFDGPGYWQQGGVLTMTWWEQEQESVVIDPLWGTGIDYRAVIAAAEEKKSTQSWWA